MFECTKECKRNRARAEQLRQEWKEKWPKYCTKCEGWGGFWYSFDPSPAGVSLSSGTLEDFDPCPDCYENGICPRCGEPGFEGEEYGGPCQKCGWDFSIACGLPAEAECWCWAIPTWRRSLEGEDDPPAILDSWPPRDELGRPLDS